MCTRSLARLNLKCDQNSKIALKQIKQQRISSPIVLPTKLCNIFSELVQKYGKSTLQEGAQQLALKLEGRREKPEDSEIQKFAKNALAKMPQSAHTQQTELCLLHLCRRTFYHWMPIELQTEQQAAIYFTARAPSIYASLYACLKQLPASHSSIVSSSVLHYGPGMALSHPLLCQLSQPPTEYVCVESSGALQQLCVRVLTGYPAASIRSRVAGFRYSTVLATHTLLESGWQLEGRLRLLESLWGLTAPDGYLVLVENGSDAGFRLLLEARKFVTTAGGRVFAPCTHQRRCPRLERGNTYCHFTVRAHNFFHSVETVKYSYMIFHKHTDRTFEAPELSERESSSGRWSSGLSRVVQPVLVRPRHVICRLCTHRGKLEEFVLTKKKSDPEMYRTARKCQWGDAVAFTITDGVPK